MQGQVFEGDWSNSHLYLKPSTSSERMHRTCTWLAGTFKPSTRIGRVIRRPMAFSLNRWNTGSAYAVHTQRSRRHPLPWQLNLPENIITTLFPKKQLATHKWTPTLAAAFSADLIRSRAASLSSCSFIAAASSSSRPRSAVALLAASAIFPMSLSSRKWR